MCKMMASIIVLLSLTTLYRHSYSVSCFHLIAESAEHMAQLPYHRKTLLTYIRYPHFLLTQQRRHPAVAEPRSLAEYTMCVCAPGNAVYLSSVVAVLKLDFLESMCCPRHVHVLSTCYVYVMLVEATCCLCACNICVQRVGCDRVEPFRMVTDCHVTSV